MRHSKLDLIMNVYTDPRQLDVASAVEALPALPTIATVFQPSRQIAPGIAPTPVRLGRTKGIRGNNQTADGASPGMDAIVATAMPVNEKGPLTVPVNEPCGVGATGLEPVTPSVSCSGVSAQQLQIAGTFGRSPDGLHQGLHQIPLDECKAQAHPPADPMVVAIAGLLNSAPLCTPYLRQRRVRTICRRESRYGRFASAKTLEIIAIGDYLSPT